jgi:acyl carrier protein
MSARLETIIASALRIPESEVTDSLRFHGTQAWDSLNHIALVLSLEAEYGVSIPDETLVKLTSVHAIREFLATQPAVLTPR